MLQNPGTLQFILDTIYKIGGAPKKLTQLQDEIRGRYYMGWTQWQLDFHMHTHTHTPHFDIGPHVTSNKEREVAIAVDHTLRRESLKASRLADELKKESLLQDPPGHQTPAHSCPVLTQCELFKDHLMDKHSLFAIGPCLATCYCSHCSAGKTVVAPSGTPPRPYNLPVGWCQFTLRLELLGHPSISLPPVLFTIHRHSRSHAHKLARNFCSEWHTAYCSVPCSQVAGMIRTGQLLRSHEKGGVLLSPDIEYAVKTAGVESEK